jgi:glyoxylase-like metal-dependent hydrolase (beta-lactamase superfamily II)
MSVRIYPIPLGLGQCYIVQDEGVIMIDGGTPKRVDNFVKAVEELPLEPEEIQLIVITHGHFDHIASVKDIKELTKAKVAMHQQDADSLEKPSHQEPPPAVTVWGHILIKTLGKFMTASDIEATEVDIVLGDEEFSLAEYGILGKAIHTPGHTPGSVSVVLETGDAFVGDLAMNGFPLRLRPGLPIFAEDLQKLKESWKLLLDQGAKTIYPGHGKPFSAHVIRKALSG